MLLFLFICFLTYLFYKLVVHFILPVYRTTQQVKRSFREMNERVNSQTASQNGQHSSSPQRDKNKKSGIGDYIDFEEVK